VSKKKENVFLLFFDLKRQMSFVYVSAMNQNHVVQGKKTDWFVGYFLLVLKRFFKVKSKMANRICLMFFILKEMTQIWLKWIKILFKKNKSGKSLDWKSS